MHSSVNIANEFLKISRDPVAVHLTPMKLLKMVYISHGWMLGLTGNPLVSEDIEAWQYGPVIPELYREIKEYRKDPVLALPQAGEVKLDTAEKDILHQVFNIYGKFSGLELSAMTHKKGTPWYTIWHERGQSVIPRELISSYYESLASNGK